MGDLKFRVTSLGVLSPHLVERAYLVSLEGIPWLSHNSAVDDLLVVTRETGESARLVIPWQVPDCGEYVLRTATLVEREQPYLLSLELARGTLNDIREYLAAEQLVAESRQDEHPQAATYQEAVDTFIEAATWWVQPERVAHLADECLRLCLQWIRDYWSDKISRSETLAQRSAGQLPTLLGIVLDDAVPDEAQQTPLTTAANLVISPAVWRGMEAQPAQWRWDRLDQQLAWAERAGLAWAAGPLLSWTRDALPDWLSLWEEDFEALQSHMVQQVQAVVKRYKGHASLWHVVHRVNTAPGLNITEQQRLELAAAGVEAARSIDRQTPVLVSFEQPWCEYLAKHRHEATPLDYAEALVRAKLGLGALGLELHLGYWPGGTGRRLPLDVEHLLHTWARLGLPLVIFLAAPSDTARDERARSSAQPVTLGIDDAPDMLQAELAWHWYHMLLDHDAVWGVVWQQLSDATPHELPSAGLLDAQGRPKPLHGTLSSLFDRFSGRS